MLDTQTSKALELELKKCNVSFDGHIVLEDINLLFKSGTKTGIIGNNGAGKSTLFNLISGLLESSSSKITGSILLDTKDISKLAPYKRADLNVGRIFQHPSLCEDLTLLDNIILGTRLKKSSGIFSSLFYPKYFLKSEIKKAETLMEEFELSAFSKTNTENLPYATRKIVELARALMGDPKLLLLDEPCASMNESERDKYKSLLNKYSETNDCTILIIEHDIDFLKATCESLLILNEGKALAFGPTDQVLENKSAMDTYYGVDTP